MDAEPLRGLAGRTPWGVAVAVGLVVLVESTIARCELDLSTPLAVTHRYAGSLTARAKDGDVLCFGDSLMKCGVVPAVLERALGRPALNLAVSGGQPSATYYLFKRTLDRGVKPSAVLVDFKVTQTQLDPLAALEENSELLTPAEALDIAREGHRPTLFASIMTRSTLPSLRFRRPLREATMAALDGRPASKRATSLMFLRNWNANRGVGLHDPNPQGEPAATERDAKVFKKFATMPITELNKRYINRFLDLAAARGIPVYWLVPPLNPTYQADRDANGEDAAYARLLASAVERHPNLTVIEGRRRGYPSGVFVDSSHLDYRGACRYTDALAGMIRTPPQDGSRVWTLPPYRETVVDVPVEVEGESDRIVRSWLAKPALAAAPAAGPVRR